MKLKKLFEQTGAKQVELARALNVREDRVTKLKDGSGIASPRELVGIARFFCVSAESLGDDRMPEALPADPLTREERSLLDAARECPGGPREALRRILAYPPEPARIIGGRTQEEVQAEKARAARRSS